MKYAKQGKKKSEIDEEVIKSIDNIIHKKQILSIEQYKTSVFKTSPMINTVRVEIEAIDSIIASLGETLVHKNTILDKEKELFNIIEEIQNSGKRLIKEITDFSDRYWLSTQNKNEKVFDSFFTDFSDLEFDRYDEYHIFLRKIQEITNDITEGINSLFIFSEHLSSNLKSLNREINHLKKQPN